MSKRKQFTGAREAKSGEQSQFQAADADGHDGAVLSEGAQNRCKTALQQIETKTRGNKTTILQNKERYLNDKPSLDQDRRKNASSVHF